VPQQIVRAGLRHNRWIETEGLDEPLDFPADVLLDLRTTGNRVSVYEVNNTVTAERVAIAVAAGKRDSDHTAYAVFDRAAVEELGITVHKTPGDTIDSAVNPFHFELDLGTTRRLVGLAGVIADSKPIPILKKRVAALLREGFESGRLDHAKNQILCDKVKANVEKRQGNDPGVESGTIVP
jgi:hypothetical protein